jgi:outer membrane protein assembly factor BamB
MEVVHLLGCSHGRLIFTTPNGCRAVGARSGSDDKGWLQPVEGKLPGFGRGLLAGGWVFWPVQDSKLPLRALNVEYGTQQVGEEVLEPTQLRQIRAGNLAFGGGCLVVAGVEELTGYVPPEHFLEKRQREAALPGAGAETWYRLAQAEVGAGLRKEAVGHLKQAEMATGDLRLQEDARAQRHQLLLKLAREAEMPLPAAADFFQQAAAAEFPAALRLRALMYLAALWRTAGQPLQEVETWQRVLQEERLRRATLADFYGGLHQAGATAVRRIGQALEEHGVKVYEDIEKEARAALAGRDLPAALVRSVARYPNSQAVGQALRKLVGQPAAAAQQADLAQAYRLFHGLYDCDLSEQKLALQGLARAYEGQQCWEAAQAVRLMLANRLGDKAAAQGLAAPERQPRPGADLNMPLRRTWHADSGRLFVPCIGPLGPRRLEMVFSLRDKELTCRDAASGSARWTRTLPLAPSWLGTHADMALAANERGIQCLRVADGRPLWAWPLADPGTDGAVLSSFQLTGEHLFFLRDGREVVALTLDTGVVHWVQGAPSADLLPEGGGRFFPRYFAGEDWVFLQTTGGGWRLFQSDTGIPWNSGKSTREPWPQAPMSPLGDGRLCMVESSRRVLMLEVRTGKEVWRWKPRLPTTLTGEAPRLFACQGTLLLLVPRNYGYDLERLDPATGAHLWPAAARLIPEAVDAAAVVTDEKAVYLACRNKLTAWSLAEGKRLWERVLTEPAPRWRVVRTGSGLVLWPVEMDWGFRWSWLPLGDVTLAVPLRARLGRPFPVLLHDPGDGRQQGRLDFETDLPEGAVQLFRERLVVTAGGTTWGVQSAPAGGARR